jgi:peroxiredoxin
VYPYLLFVFLQAPLPQGVPLIEDCSEPEHVIATLTPDDDVQVRSSLAGGAQTCYAVTAVVGGKSLKGYVLGGALPATATYEQNRRPVLAPLEVPEAKTPTPAPQEERPRLPLFPDFSAVDMQGRPVSLQSLAGKVILICFWSPLNDNSQRELIGVNRLYKLYHRQGVDAITISLSSNRIMIRDSLEDFGITLPTISNDFGLGARHNLTRETIPVTYVLNEKHEILATGLHGDALESAVQKLVRGQ